MRYVIIMAVFTALFVGMAEQHGQTALAVSSLVDTDFDGCNDAEEIAFGLDPNNSLDFSDFVVDGGIDIMDQAFVIFRWGSKFGSLLYDVYYDRNNGTVGGGPDGDIDIFDLQQVFGQHGLQCQGVPAMDLNQVCSDLQGEAAAEGYTDFTCSTDPVTDPQSNGHLPIKKRVAQVSLRWDKSVVVENRDLDIDNTASAPPASMQPEGGTAGIGETADFHPSECNNSPCHVTHTRKVDLRHFRGHGPNCAWMKLRQEYDEYSPWAAIYNVEEPVVWGNATFPCEDDNMQGSLDTSGLPIWGQSRAEVDWEAGVPTPWGLIGLRSWHAVIVLTYWANYTVDTDYYY